MPKPFIKNLEQATLDNDYYRKVLFTGEHSQLVIMTLLPKEEIGEEVHKVDQFFRLESGQGKVIVNGEEHFVEEGDAIVVPAGARHNVINTGEIKMRLYTIYTPPEHKDGTVHKTKAEAEADEADHYRS